MSKLVQDTIAIRALIATAYDLLQRMETPRRKHTLPSLEAMGATRLEAGLWTYRGHTIERVRAGGWLGIGPTGQVTATTGQRVASLIQWRTQGDNRRHVA